MIRWILPLVVGALLAGCPRFRTEPLPGGPADATYVDVDGVHVHYKELGAGPAVVLVHGYGATLDSWATVAPHLASEGHRVIAIDLKGFGWTSRPEGDYGPAAQAELVWHVLDKLKVIDVAIVAHSWGSSVALAMAVAQPARVRRVALYDAYVYDDQVPGFFSWAKKDGLGELLFGLFYAERIEDRAPLAFYDERWVTQARVAHVEREMERDGTVAAALATARGHAFAKLHEQLKGFAKPVLLLWGENDQVTPLRYGQRLAQELENAELKVYPRCGHIPMVEAHQTSTRDLLAFIGKDVPPPPVEGDPPPAAPVVIKEIPEALPPPLVAENALPVGADLAALGVELTPRQYASPREGTEVVIHGSLRARDAYLYNLDLDRGLDTKGQPLFPVPLGGGQALNSSDLRARTDLAVYARGVGVAVKARIDWLDNVALGGEPDLAGGSPATSGGQKASYAVVKRAWGEALTPLGILAVGRMGAHFGLGIAANGGDCEDCDHGDAADRAAFVMAIGGHLLAFAYDLASTGPFVQSKDGGHAIGLEPSDSAAGPTIALLKIHSPAALLRRAAAGLSSLEYGAYLSRRTQDRDVPASYLTTSPPANYTSNDLTARGFAALTTGAWARFSGDGFRIEAELAYASASIEQPSLIPGAAITQEVTSSQLGFALQSDLAVGPALLGLDAGYASGDDAPGFGAFPTVGSTSVVPGSLDGPQASLPRDHTVDNFRFHPDFHIDNILFREIIGTITDAVYLRPHVRTTLMQIGTGRLELGAALIASWAVEPTSTPSGSRPLGIELDPQLRYASRDGFAATLDYGLLLPGSAFERVASPAGDTTTLKAQPAQCVRARLVFAF